MVHSKKRYREAPFFYKYRSLSHSHTLSLASSPTVARVDEALSEGRGMTQKMCAAPGRDTSDFSVCVNLRTGAPACRRAQGYTHQMLQLGLSAVVRFKARERK